MVISYGSNREAPAAFLGYEELRGGAGSGALDPEQTEVIGDVRHYWRGLPQ